MTKQSNMIKKDRGFTIVELLVVIVVIGILAAITIVSYTGVTAKANSASAVSTAANITKKMEVYYIDSNTSAYPPTLATLTGAATSTTYYMSGVTLDATILSSGNLPSKPSEINYFKCGTNGTSTAPVAPATNITIQTGGRVGYWDYSATTPAITYDDVGQISGTFNTFPVVCLISAS